MQQDVYECLFVGCSMSKQVFLQDAVNPHALHDGTSAYADFIGSRNQRFTSPDSATKKHIL